MTNAIEAASEDTFGFGRGRLQHGSRVRARHLGLRQPCCRFEQPALLVPSRLKVPFSDGIVFTEEELGAGGPIDFDALLLHGGLVLFAVTQGGAGPIAPMLASA